jgi:branched-chain amino acid aminotransferase
MGNQGRVWFNGKLRESSECMVHVASHALHYGSSVFEGIRAYDTPDGTKIFRLRDHLNRLKYSADVYRIPLRYSLDELHAACRETVRDSGLKSVYIRPIVFRGNCGLGVMPRDISVVDVAIMVSPWGAYLGEEGLKNGIKACITSWNRLAPNTMPPGVKAGGMLSEGAGENIFLVVRNRLLTPPAAASILSGITRDTVITLAEQLGIQTVEAPIAREQIYGADEIFMTGTAAEVTPVRQVDHMTIGNGGCGPLTRRLQDAFFGLFKGQTHDRWGWLEPV